MGKESIVSDKMKLLLSLVALHFCFAGFHIVSRVALNIGIRKVVYPVYRNIIALLLFSPFAYFLGKKERPPLTFPLLVQFFLLALLGITANQGLYLLGLYYASPTFASAMQNSVPAITFIMAAALRLEQINIARRDGLAKVLGTIASIGGATIITLCKGSLLLHQSNTTHGRRDVLKENAELDLGMYFSPWALLIMACLAPVLNKYPAKLTLTSFTCFFGLIQFLIIAAFVETVFNHWKIQSKEELFTILYAGVVASGIVFSLQTWCIQKGGPVLVAVFQPLQTLVVAVMAFVFLGDQLYSGCVIGAVLIIVGLYLVLWGKTEEKNVGKAEDTLKKHLPDGGENRDMEEGGDELNAAWMYY
ncbi:hypothetical protein REPUB_Repub07fG0101400 [Reevesia pubescens]